MEIPVIGRIGGFESSELIRLQNVSFISRVFQESIKVPTLWTLGALILALLATLTRFNLVIFRFRKGRSVTSQHLLHQHSDESDSECESEDDSDQDDRHEEEEDSSSLSSEEDFRLAGFGSFEELFGQNRKLSRSLGEFGFSWTDFVNGSSSIVKSWEGIGSIIDQTSGPSTASGELPIPVFPMPTPAVIVSAGIETGNNVALRVFDTRVGRQIPQMFAELQPCRKTLDGDGEVIVRDIRKIASPVENLTESWWESEGVSFDGDREVCWLDGGSGGSVVSRCRNAVFGHLF